MDGELYFECGSGISGDMAVAAMLDLGADADGLMDALDSLGIGGFEARVSDVVKSGVRAKDFSVALEEDNRDHDAGYLYGSDAEVAHGHGRGYREIAGILERSALSEGAKEISLRTLRILGEAEASVHGVPLEEVHFHEVGAVDSIVDIAALGYCLDALGFGRVSFSELCEGTGVVRCQHGIIPVPAPAVTSIASAYSLPLRITSSAGEYVTPTGAAFAAAARTCGPPGSFTIERVGTGAGKRESERSGLLRAMVVHPLGRQDRAVKLECNLDDCTGEELGHAMERLYAAGAREVNYSPVYMKKNRPGWLLTVVCREDERPALEEVIFRETSTIGIRRTPVERTVLERASISVPTPYGEIRVKVSEGCGTRKLHPEYDDVARAARESGAPFRDVYDAAAEAARRA